MRRIAPLVALAAITLVPTLVAGCDGDGDDDVATLGTVAVGTLPGALGTESTSPGPSSSDTKPTGPTSEQAASTSEPTTEPATTDPATTDPPTTVPYRTSLSFELADLVDDPGGAAPLSNIVVDDTGRMQMALPDAWSDRRTAPSTLADGTASPSISASPDMTAFLDGYDEPGLTAVVVDADPDTALDAYAFGEDCTGQGRSVYEGDRLAGEYEVWRDCGGSANDIVTVAVRQGRLRGTVLVLAQVVDGADLAALDAALATLRLDA